MWLDLFILIFYAVVGRGGRVSARDERSVQLAALVHAVRARARGPPARRQQRRSPRARGAPEAAARRSHTR